MYLQGMWSVMQLFWNISYMTSYNNKCIGLCFYLQGICESSSYCNYERVRLLHGFNESPSIWRSYHACITIPQQTEFSSVYSYSWKFPSFLSASALIRLSASWAGRQSSAGAYESDVRLAHALGGFRQPTNCSVSRQRPAERPAGGQGGGEFCLPLLSALIRRCADILTSFKCVPIGGNLWECDDKKAWVGVGVGVAGRQSASQPGRPSSQSQCPKHINYSRRSNLNDAKCWQTAFTSFIIQTARIPFHSANGLH